MTNYQCARALVYIAEVIIKTFGEEFGYEVQEPKQEPKKEPLIKNKKIRKAIRAWSEANGIETVEYDEYWVSFRRDDKTISFKDQDTCLGFYGLKDSKDYAIDELCGEEEE